MGEKRRSDGELREAISNLIVGTWADRLGRGPTRVRTYVAGEVVVCLMADTMTQAERSLAAAGREATVHQMRTDFQETLREEVTRGIEALTGRTVIAFFSDNSLAPDMAAEIFVFDGKVD
jgi:uncharacterized protein YbcI